MRLLFVHQNFPGQYRHLAAHYAAAGGHEVVCVGEKGNLLRQRPALAGAKLLGYELPELKPAPGAFEGSVRAIGQFPWARVSRPSAERHQAMPH